MITSVTLKTWRRRLLSSTGMIAAVTASMSFATAQQSRPDVRRPPASTSTVSSSIEEQDPDRPSRDPGSGDPGTGAAGNGDHQAPGEQGAEQDDTSGESLASQARDPTAAVTAFQIRFDYVSSFHNLPDADQTSLVLQPIIPWKMGEQRHISRLTLPFVLNAPDWGTLAGIGNGTTPPPGYVPTEEQNGMGDLAAVDFFLWDASWGRWGVGPAVIVPTATDPALGTEKLSVGPAAVAIFKVGELQAGSLVQSLFSVAGASDRDDVRTISIQPFASYGLGGGWSVGTSELVYNYDLDAGRWTNAPIGGRVETLIHIGSLPVRIYVDTEYNFIDKAIAPEWTFRFAFVPLFGGG